MNQRVSFGERLLALSVPAGIVLLILVFVIAILSYDEEADTERQKLKQRELQQQAALEDINAMRRREFEESDRATRADLYNERLSGAGSSGSTANSASSTGTSSATTGRRVPTSKYTCPDSHPIKGNNQSMIYHLRGGEFYDATAPEECFDSESAAQRAGYRRSLR